MTKKRPARPSRRSPADFRAAARALRAFALGLPGTSEHFPWGERVAKAGGKVFVFLGADPVPGGPLGLSVKLPVSNAEALDLPFVRPTGYGLGRAGWVTAKFEPPARPPVALLEAWIEESYRAIAPRRLVAELDARAERARSKPAVRRRARPRD
ncbi:MAG TPA: MmcQ/YjbR family DNA-binding protein [Thermoanaerobaculia bacterium]|nr:MmcQ/YjbR family DNA-binding protein [Thermoanaerobaculia bacterium]